MPVNAMYYKSQKKSIITHEYSLGQEKLSVVPSRHPYLGIEIDNKLSWKQHIEKTKQKSIPTLNMVRRNLTKGTTSQIRNQIFTGLVRPTLEYGCIESESEMFLFDPYKKYIQSNNETILDQGTPIKTSLVANIRAAYYIINSYFFISQAKNT